MATGQSKENQTTTRIPFYGSVITRLGSSTKDVRYINCIPEAERDNTLRTTKTYLVKRAGVSNVYTTLPAAAARGIAYFNGAIYSAIGGYVYKAGSATPIITLNGTSGHVGMKVGNSSSTGDYLFICDGTDAWHVSTSDVVTPVNTGQLLTILVTNGGTGYGAPTAVFSGGGGINAAATVVVEAGIVTAVNITNVGSGYTSAPTCTITGGGGSSATCTVYLNSIPSPHVPIPQFMDGYIFLAESGTGNIFNSYLDDATKWDSASFINAEMYPDDIVALARQNNQIVALGEYSAEFFYDAANASGSPLSSTNTTSVQIGTCAPYAVSDNERNTIYITQSKTGGRSVWMLTGFVPSRISDEHVDRILELETTPSNIRGYTIRTMGHYLYVINLPVMDRTLVYDMDEKVWSEWSSYASSAHHVFNYNYVADDTTGKPVMLHKTSGEVARLDPAVFQDIGSDIYMEASTSRFDGNTMNRKFMDRLFILGDTTSASATVNIKWSDDDQITYSGTRTYDIGLQDQSLKQCGSFRRRSFVTWYTGNTGLRLEGLETVFRKGVH
jgi:hypothetical protein